MPYRELEIPVHLSLNTKFKKPKISLTWSSPKLHFTLRSVLRGKFTLKRPKIMQLKWRTSLGQPLSWSLGKCFNQVL